MAGKLNRREALLKVGGAALGVEALLALDAPSVDAAGSATTTPSVRGAWMIQPKQGGKPAAFEAIACFAAGGVFVTTGSDEAGTGLGEWTGSAPNHFAFTYVNFHFDAQGKHKDTVEVSGSGTFTGTTLKGTATLRKTDAYGHTGAPQSFSFTGKRMGVPASPAARRGRSG